VQITIGFFTWSFVFTFLNNDRDLKNKIKIIENISNTGEKYNGKEIQTNYYNEMKRKKKETN